MPVSQSARADALARLNVLVGEWREQVTLPGSGPLAVSGRTVFEWGTGDYNLQGRFRCRFAADTAMSNSIQPVIAVDGDQGRSFRVT